MLAGVLATLTAILGAFQSPKIPPPVPAALPPPAEMPSPAAQSDGEPRVEPVEVNPSDPVERWRPLVQESGLPVEWAMRTMRCESRGNPGAVNRAGPYHGLMQVYRGSFDPATNLAQARSILARQGRRAWPQCG